MPLEKGNLGNTIRTHRIQQGITQEELAEMVDITPTHLKHLESEHRNPSIEVLFRLTTVLNMSLDNLLFTNQVQESTEYKELSLLLSKCTTAELQIVSDLAHSLLKHRPNNS